MVGMRGTELKSGDRVQGAGRTYTVRMEDTLYLAEGNGYAYSRTVVSSTNYIRI